MELCKKIEFWQRSLLSFVVSYALFFPLSYFILFRDDQMPYRVISSLFVSLPLPAIVAGIFFLAGQIKDVNQEEEQPLNP